MNITAETRDGGKMFDWGKASTDYAKYRDIYQKKIYAKNYKSQALYKWLKYP